VSIHMGPVFSLETASSRGLHVRCHRRDIWAIRPPSVHQPERIFSSRVNFPRRSYRSHFESLLVATILIRSRGRPDHVSSS